MMKRIYSKWLLPCALASVCLLWAGDAFGQVQQRQAGPQPSQTPAPQQTRVTGNVRSAAGDGLIGVAVSVDGTNNVAITGVDGAYSLNVPAGATLRFNLLGYSDQLIAVNGRTSIDVVLLEDTTLIDDVVVVGYGTQRRANLTGSVATVGADVIESKVATNLMTALTGEVPGFTISNRSGQPGNVGTSSMRVRGTGTMGSNENATPLVLVDGMPMSMNDVHPNDVESVTVLKDAASAAIYGSRAANGVILITTKSGRAGKLRLTYNGSFGVTMATRLPDQVTSWQFAEMWNEGKRNQNENPERFPDDMIARMKTEGNPDADEGSTDWYREVMVKAPLRHMHQLSASGGNETLTYMASLGYDQQNGLLPNTPWERYTARINTRAKLTPWFDLGFNLSTQISNRTEPRGGINGSFLNLNRGMPFKPVKYSDGTWSFITISTNPMRNVNGDYGLTTFDSNMTTIQLAPRINLAKGLVFDGNFSYFTTNSFEKRHQKIVNYDAVYWQGTELQGALPDVARNSVEDRWQMRSNMMANAYLTYNVTAAELHDISLMMGVSAESRKMKENMAGRMDLPSNDDTAVTVGSASTATATGRSTYSSIASLYGRLTYAYAGKYLFETNFRYDGSSKFARGHRWGFFPSFSAGWRISEESFFAGWKSTVSNLKLRGSWGLLGNQSIDDFQFLSTYGPHTDANWSSWIFGGQVTDGLREARLGNEVVTWETSRNFNIGLDMSFLQNRMEVVFDWFSRNTNNILLAMPKPSTVGIGVPMVNAGTIGNKGWEFALTWNDKLWGGKGSYRIGFNIADVKNKILDMSGYRPSTGGTTIRREGDPIDALFGFETIGIAFRQDDVDKYGAVMRTRSPDWALGDMILKDQNGDGRINNDDKIVIGDPTPRYTYGLNLGFNYGNFDASLFLQGVGKASGYVTVEMLSPLLNVSGRKDHYYDSFWPSKQNYDAKYPRLLADWGYNWDPQTAWVQNAAFLRLKAMQIGYSFELPKLGISKLRVNLSGENMFTITKFTVWDPEAPTNTRQAYPMTAVYSVGVNITF